MFPHLQVRDILDLVAVEKIPVFGFMLLAIVALAWMLKKANETAERLRAELEQKNKEHRKETQELNDNHAKILQEMNNAMMTELRNSANAYKEQSETLKLIMKSQRQ